jgi:sugar/nucleoside kinase (ribokinase family)
LPHPKNTGRLICFGDLCIDIVARTAEISPAASDIDIETLAIRPAGAALNVAIAAAESGADVRLIGLIGNDSFGVMILSEVNAARIDISLLKHCPDRTGTVISLVRPDGERTLLSHRGANRQPYGILPSDLLTPDDYLYLSGYSMQHPASAATACQLKTLAQTVAFDPSYQFAVSAFDRWFLAGLHIITPNLEEARLMTGRTTPADCAAALRDLGIEIVLITLDSEGCYLDTGDHKRLIPTTPASGADTTGAGDTFCGTLLAKCLQGHDIVTAAEMANQAASRRVCN